MYAMAGGTPDHATIAKNLDRAFLAGIETRGCRGYSSDASVKVSEFGDYVFPDSSYACEEPQYDGNALVNPTLVVEVLPPSTERDDRRRKVPLYRAIPSVQQILLIAADEPLVESQRRHGDLWELQEARGLGASIPVLGHPARLADIYRFIDFE